MSAPASAGEAPTAALEAAAEAWNRGDLEGFLAAYEDAPDTVFVRADRVLRGVAAIRAMYESGYAAGGRRGMGRLAFSELDVRDLGSADALLIGRYELHRSRAEGGAVSGYFSLLMRRTAKGWRIVVDHTP